MKSTFSALTLFTFFLVTFSFELLANERVLHTCEVRDRLMVELNADAKTGNRLNESTTTNADYKEKISIQFVFDSNSVNVNLNVVQPFTAITGFEVFNSKKDRYGFESSKGKNNTISTSPKVFEKYGGLTTFFTLRENQMEIIERNFAPERLTFIHTGDSLIGYLNRASNKEMDSYLLVCAMSDEEWIKLSRLFGKYIG